MESGIRSFWNFSSYDFKLKYEEYPSVNVHLGDSLLTLSYLVNHPKGGTAGRISVHRKSSPYGEFFLFPAKPISPQPIVSPVQWEGTVP